MKKLTYFYTELINIQEIEMHLSKLSLTSKEKKHLLALSEEHLHLRIMDMILSELPEEHKKVFVAHVKKSDHDKAKALLKQYLPEFDIKIISTAKNVMEELIEDIHTIEKEL